MYAYSVGYSGYEDGHDVILLHAKKFTKKQFEDMVVEAYVAAAKSEVKLIEEANENYRAENIAEAEAKRKSEHPWWYAHHLADAELGMIPHLRPSTLLGERDRIRRDDQVCVVDFMVEQYGFEKIQFQQKSYIFNDRYSLAELPDKHDYKNNKLKRRIAKRIRDEVYVEVDRYEYINKRRKEIIESLGLDYDEISKDYVRVPIIIDEEEDDANEIAVIISEAWQLKPTDKKTL